MTETSPLPPKVIVKRAADLQQKVASLLASIPHAEQQARVEYEAEHKRVTYEQLHRMSLDRLKQLMKGSVRLTSVEASGIRTVGQLLDRRQDQLETIQGVGPTTATRLLDAAHLAKAQLANESRIRFDVKQRPVGQTSLLRALYRLDVARHYEASRPVLEDMSNLIAKDIRAARLEYQPLRRFFFDIIVQLARILPARLECRPLRRFFSSRKDAARAALKRIDSLLKDDSTINLQEHLRATEERLSDRTVRVFDVWADYTARSAHYNALLAEVGGLDPDTEASQGLVPAEIIEKIKQFDLDIRLLNVTLRRYQAFGAKYAIVQKHTILGDEMGLGKTIEALAVLCHLKRQGRTHFLVVCPASVLVNWEHEIIRHSRLGRPLRLHGPERIQRLGVWKDQGGLAVTTFDTLRLLNLPNNLAIAAMVVDEAHFVKNPRAQRTIAVRQWLSRAGCSILMTGTPMENRVEEFQTLVDHVQPDTGLALGNENGFLGAEAFRRAVSTVYLRRNQSDVLQELPERIETDDWLTLEGAAADTYRRAVESGNFMAMRRAAFMTDDPSKSPKLTRLLEITSEAADRGLKTVVFSFFRDVIARVHEELVQRATEPITGNVPAGRRQQIVDQFTASASPSVLISQVEAGGVGLNLQTASVVILAEPQWKPSTEEQAIARCYRMGQVRRVEVHRLLTEDSVDERMVEILHGKSVLFNTYARGSTIKDSTPDAIDARDQSKPEKAMSQRERERQIIASERRRLGLPVGTLTN